MGVSDIRLTEIPPLRAFTASHHPLFLLAVLVPIFLTPSARPHSDRRPHTPPPQPRHALRPLTTMLPRLAPRHPSTQTPYAATLAPPARSSPSARPRPHPSAPSLSALNTSYHPSPRRAPDARQSLDAVCRTLRRILAARGGQCDGTAPHHPPAADSRLAPSRAPPRRPRLP